VHVISAAAYANLIHAEPHMDEEHDHDGDPVIELNKYGCGCGKLISHSAPLCADGFYVASEATLFFMRKM
jgi:hypothetical protein